MPVKSSLPQSARRLLGLDVGDRRIGIAVSDPTGLLATPVEVYSRRGDDEDDLHILELVREYEADGVVIGLPVNMNGTEGPQALKTREFAQRVACALDVVLWDERLSTVEAERRMAETKRRKRRGVIQRSDAEAASVILESYLDSVRGRAAV